MHRTLRMLPTLSLLCATTMGCHVDYELHSLTCAEGSQGRLYDLNFGVGIMELLADVTCVEDASDAWIEVQSGIGTTVELELRDCQEVPNSEDRGRIDLIGCDVVSPYSLKWGAGQEPCQPPGAGYSGGSDVWLMVARDRKPVLDRLYVPVDVESE